MNKIIQENRGVIRFIAVFVSSYVVFSLFYSFYLKEQVGLDSFSGFITDQSIVILNSIGYETYGESVEKEKIIKLIVRGKFTSFITEGCNAMSIMILFVSFVLSFAKRLKSTILFLLAGLVFIYVVNLLRIVFLTAILYHYPSYTHVLHGVVFPGIIYGAVFLLWVYWVRYVKKTQDAV
ncbi:exosortase family protein XrtF [Pseudofulvibacter geojedonensis]|uniref:Exosortase family protein XrtF n=1 Tax=Pseudofulvibacter geojedonensis TaxID=1123758 RepID=A0ABW3I3Y0_9FLAO